MDATAALDEIRHVLGYGPGVSCEDLVATVKSLQSLAEGSDELVPIKRKALELTGKMRRIKNATLEDAADALDDVFSGRAITGVFAQNV